MTYTYQCAGYEGHECKAMVKRKHRPKKTGNKARCPDCKKAAYKLVNREPYQKEYYRVHRQEFLDYQKRYNATRKKKQKAEQEKIDQNVRQERKSAYSHSDLMHLPPEKLAKAIEKMRDGKAELAGVK